jgi:predicted dehydrogenase
VIGAGYWGPNLVRTALATPALRLEWLCDLDVTRARRVLGPYTTVRATDSFDAVLDDPAVAAVAIATPAATHFDLVRSALEAGKHVLVEKPLTPSVAEGEKLAALAAGYGRVLIDSVRINLGLVQPDVDVLWDLAPHDLSILDFVLPPDVTPVALAAHVVDPIGAGRACLGYLSLWLSNGALAHVHVNWLSPTKIRTSVFGGSRRTIVWDDINPAGRLAVHDRGVDTRQAGSVPPDERREALISYRTGDTLIPALPEREALKSVMTEFAAAISEGRPARTDAAAGLRVLRLLEAASRSAQTGGARINLEGATE